jgi:hypothetical protein
MTNDALNKEEFLTSKALFILFFTECGNVSPLWNESLVDFYLTKYHLFSDTGNLLIGSYAAIRCL